MTTKSVLYNPTRERVTCHCKQVATSCSNVALRTGEGNTQLNWIEDLLCGLGTMQNEVTRLARGLYNDAQDWRLLAMATIPPRAARTPLRRRQFRNLLDER